MEIAHRVAQELNVSTAFYASFTIVVLGLIWVSSQKNTRSKNNLNILNENSHLRQ